MNVHCSHYNHCSCISITSCFSLLICHILQAVFDSLTKKSDDPILQSIGMPFEKFQKILAVLQATCATSSDPHAVKKIATEAGFQTDKVEADVMASYAGFIESSLCNQGADASTWANAWAMVVQKMHTSHSLLPMKVLFPDQSGIEKDKPSDGNPEDTQVKNDACH